MRRTLAPVVCLASVSAALLLSGTGGVAAGTGAFGSQCMIPQGGGLQFPLSMPPRDTQSSLATATTNLVADNIDFGPSGNRVTATGHVEVLRGNTRLRAHRVIYDRTTDTVVVEGPITLVDGAHVVVVADYAKLSTDLRNGLLESARMVLDRKLQLAARQINRVDGRYTQLSETVASSCRVSARHPVPVWEIRARRVIHDQQKRRLHFDHAQFRIAGVPVFYLPHFTLPDPSVKRADGFLRPTFSTTSQLGSGIKLPYFITLGDHADLTFTPYLTTGGSRTLQARYRQRLASGGFDATGAITRDQLTSASWRGYLFANGSFAMPRDYTLSFNLELTSDPAYLIDYGYSDKDRLASSVSLTRTRRDQHVEVGLIGFRSLRAGDINAQIPTLVSIGELRQRFTPAWIGGQASFGLSTTGYYRSETDPAVGPSRDALRASASLDWRRSWTLGNGMLASAAAAATADFYRIEQDPAVAGSFSRLTPIGAVELRWPFARTSAGGASEVIEPVVQAVFSRRRTSGVPNEDSTLVEFDTGNLFSFSRFAGADRRETGNRLNLGVSYTRIDPAGWSLGATLGRVIRAHPSGQFSAESGLAGRRSDWLSEINLDFGKHFSLRDRAVFSDTMSLAQNEMRLAWRGARAQMASSYVWLQADPAESRLLDTSEMTVDGSWALPNNWRARGNWRYDFVAGHATRAGVALSYSTECIRVDLSLSRRFTSSTTVSPSTGFGLSVELIGFGSSPRAGMPAQRCSG